MRPYTHLTQEQRYQISVLLKAGPRCLRLLASQAHQSIISREVWRI
ncbi:MAG: hypothetical protein R3B83_05985 [Nitrospirales bacterium]|nr:hypothetical protein [Nitrospirales bacterium]